MEYGWGLDSPCPISGFRVTMYDYQAMCRPPTHHHSASQPLVSVSVPPGLPSTRWWPVPFSPGTRAHLGPLPLPPLTHSPLPPRSYLTGQGGSGQLLQQRDSCSCLLAWFPPSPPHGPQPIRDPIDATQGDDWRYPLIRSTAGISQNSFLLIPLLGWGGGSPGLTVHPLSPQPISAILSATRWLMNELLL